MFLLKIKKATHTYELPRNHTVLLNHVVTF